MKIRNGFVSNSSSSSFVLHNKTNHKLELKEFVQEARDVVTRYIVEYGMPHTVEARANDTLETMTQLVLKVMEREAKRLGALVPGANFYVFGDEDGTTIGLVYDYALRRGGATKRFGWSQESGH